MFRERTTSEESSSVFFLSFSPKGEYMTVLHCVFIVWQILMYMNDSFAFINKRFFSVTSLLLLCDRYLGFPPLHEKKPTKCFEVPFIGSLRV